METLYDCVVVANGSFPQTAGPLKLSGYMPTVSIPWKTRR